ncbi:subtilisin-like protein [Stipitochalara longipes BDJ]|nr:subtilisin-like protein [Stipitochalara longipes BDJ]
MAKTDIKRRGLPTLGGRGQVRKPIPADVVAKIENTALQVDLDLFYQTYSPNIPAGTHPVAAFIDAIVYPQTTTDYQTDYSQYNLNSRPDDPNIDPVYPASQHQCGLYAPTNVISLSHGLVERDYPDYYQIRQCNEFMKLALEGVTIVAASGDNGVSDRNSARCLGPNRNAFVPNYPSCPYVTLVGATELPSGSSPGNPETAPTSGFASGGGFSNIFGQPSYQADAVNSFITNHNPPFPSYSSLNGSIGANGGIYNRIGRAYPDMSANGVNGALVYSQSPTTLGGTSMSTPLVAAIFIRINDERLAVGKSPIGFVNPTLYANPQTFNDITVGDQSLG